MSSSLRVLMALFFYPRGGSAMCMKYLAQALGRRGIKLDLISGSLGDSGDRTHAPSFFDPLRVNVMDYTPAVERAEAGEDPMTVTPPLHPSFEARLGVPDRAFTAVDPDLEPHIIEAWCQLFEPYAARELDVVHLHHLSPMQAAIRHLLPDTPVVGHIHGTELSMLEEIADRIEIARKLGTTLEEMANREESGWDNPVGDISDRGLLDEREQAILETTTWSQWRFGEYWRRRLCEYASMCDRLVAVGPLVRDAAIRDLEIEPPNVLSIPNGVDVQHFDRHDLSAEERLRLVRYWLVEDPQGWDESGEPGTVRYTTDDIERLVDPDTGELYPILLFVGRFMRMKRVPLLLRAFNRAQSRFQKPASLLVWGGNPGEWEDEHPVEIARQERIENVFFLGWRGHDELPLGLNSVDVMVAPSKNEPFGQVYLEAMACGLPVVATRSGGPLGFINQHEDAPDGWMVAPDDEADLAEALIDAVNNDGGRKQRGEQAYRTVREAYSWERISEQFTDLYQSLRRE